MQLGAWAIALGLSAWMSTSLTVAHALGLQALCAAALAHITGSERWWIAIHLAFSPLLAVGVASGLDPRWSLAILATLLLCFWGTLGTRVPLFFSGSDAVAAVEHLLPKQRPLSLLDLGCGIGSVVVPLGRRHRDIALTGIESAPAPWLLAWFRAWPLPNVRIRRGDFLEADWSDYDVVYAFLSPHPMADVWDKARREMRDDALLVSKDFPVIGIAPDECVPLPGGGTLYAYRTHARTAPAVD